MMATAVQNFFISRSFHEAEAGRGEASDVREDGCEIAAVHAEPRRDGGEVLVNRGRRNPAARAGVVRAVDGERGQFSVSLPAQHRAAVGRARAAEDEMVAAPAVVAAHAVARKRAAKIAGSE